MESNHLISNAQHDLGVLLQRAGQYEEALAPFHESLKSRIASIRSAEAGNDEAEMTMISKMYETTLRELRELRDQQDNEHEDTSRDNLDLFPLLLSDYDLHAVVASPLYLPPIPRLVGLRENEAPNHNAEAARTLLNMALCNLSKVPHPFNDKAKQYLTMARQVLPDATIDEPLLAADMSHAEAVAALANGFWSDAEIAARDALRLYFGVAFGILRRQESEAEDRRRAKEGAADALSLILRLFHLAGRRAEALEHFDELLRFRIELHGRDSLQVAATMHNMGIVLLASSSGQQQEEDYDEAIAEEARERLQALARHPSLDVGRHNSPLIRAEMARALGAIKQHDGDLELALGIKFYAHAAAA